VHFAPRAKRLAATSQDGRLRVFDVASHALLWEVSIPSQSSGWPGVLFGASWSPDGSELVTSTHDGRIQLRSAVSGALLRETVRPGLLFTQRCHDGRHILASSYTNMRGMELLDAGTLATVWSSGPTSHLWPVLAPGCQRVFSANWRGLLGVWDASSGRIVTEFAALPPGNPRLGVSPDGNCVVLVAGGRLAFFDARQRR
jgi:WD40 repeat protein